MPERLPALLDAKGLQAELSLTLPADVVDAIAERAAELVLERVQRDTVASPWLPVCDAAAYLGVSERTLERALARGRLRSSMVGRRRLLHRDDLDAFVRRAAGEETAPTAPPRRSPRSV
jgi:excisionase family DNA binding protein